MKTLKSFLVVALFSVSFLTASFATEPVKTNAELQAQLSSLILDSDAFEKIDSEKSIIVKLMIMPTSEVLVISTNDAEYDATLKTLLNYKKLDVSDDFIGKTFVLPVRLEK